MNSRLRMMACMLLMASLSLLAGCDAIAYVGNAFHDDRVPARYALPKGAVVVLVDDPDHRLGDPSLPNVVAAWASQDIRKNVSKVTIIPTAKVVELAQKTGQEFATMPVDQIGSELGADSVIYVTIESAGVQSETGLYRPRASARVSVVDVATGKRVYPAGGATSAASAQGGGPQGEPVQVIMHYTSSDQNPVAERAVFMRTLAQEIGQNVARVFYKHAPPSVPGYTD